MYFQMMKDPGNRRHRDAILDSLLQTQLQHGCDLEVVCSDGSLQVHGLVLASIIPSLDVTNLDLDQVCVLLPEISLDKFTTFLQCLYNTKIREFNQSVKKIISEICSLLGYNQFDDLTDSPSAAGSPVHPSNVEDAGDDDSVSNESEDVTKNQEKTSSKSCVIMNLTQIDIDNVTDEVISDNFSDQEQRLVCFVCYRLMGCEEHRKFRQHIKSHDRSLLEKVTISVPVVGKGGPGLKKKYLTDLELENKYKNVSGTELVCNKCDKHSPISDKHGFRKHLAYHNLKEKKYLYQCPKCPLKFTDNSNLKRHILSIHDRQSFRCLHCDFEDNRKKRLEDHMSNAHNDRGQCETEDISLDKGEGSAALADLAANDAPLASFNAPSADTDNVLLDNSKSSSPNILQKYSYQCTGCKFRKRKLAAVEDHIKENHPESLDLLIKKIALRSKDGNEQSFTCKLCNAKFKKKTLLNQHNYKVHEIQLDTEYTCTQCGVSCANLPGLKAHTRAHLTKQFLCANCNKSFLILSQLKDHVDKGVCMEKNRKCNVCDRVFSGKYHLELHMRLHNNEKPFQCEVCKKSFAQSRSLKEHMLTHESERQFKCSYCDKKFVQRNHLKYHLTSQHSEDVTDIPKHQCLTCGKAFPFPYQLKRHEKIHLNNPKSGLAKIDISNDTNIADVEILSCGMFPDLGQFQQPPITVVLPDLHSEASNLSDISNIDLDAAMKSVHS